MNTKQFKQQFEYECVCGYVWINDTCTECPMCGEPTKITATVYESLPPETFADRTKRK